MMLDMSLDASDAYNARDYARVVRMLGETSREFLFANPDQGFMLADAGRRVGGVPDVIGLITGVVDAARLQRAYGTLCNALNLQGVLLLEAGHSHAAERAWCDLVVVATEADNSEFVARASNNLGVAAILTMRLEDAIVSFNRSVGAYLRLGSARGLAQSHQNLGIVFRELDHERESLVSFERAMTWAFTEDRMDDVARAEQEIALLLLYTGRDLSTAATIAQQALGRFTDLGQPVGRAEALRAVGVVAIGSGDDDAAKSALAESLAIARACGQKLLEGEVLLALAARPEAAERPALLDRAEAIFNEMGAAAWGAQVRMRMDGLYSHS